MLTIADLSEAERRVLCGMQPGCISIFMWAPRDEQSALCSLEDSGFVGCRLLVWHLTWPGVVLRRRILDDEQNGG